MTKDDLKNARAKRRVAEDAIKPRSKLYSHLSASLIALIAVLILHQFNLGNLKGLLFDSLHRLFPKATAHPDVVLIAYDDESSGRYEFSPRIPPEEIEKTLKHVNSGNPFAVLFVGEMNERVYTDTELSRLALTFSKIKNMYVGYTDDVSLGQNSSPSLFHSTKYFPGYISRDTFSYGADSVTRRVMVNVEGIPTAYMKVATLYHNTHNVPIALLRNVERVGDSHQTYIHWQGPAGTYPKFPSTNVSSGIVSPETFKNKIVLFGSALQAKKGVDHIFTPYSREHFSTLALEGAANSLVTLIRDDGLQRSSSTFDLLLCLFVALLTVNCVLYLSPGRGILFVLVLNVALVGVGLLYLRYYGIWINLAHPIIAACFGYYVVIPFRLLDEYRKRWHYQEKSEMMAELENLKSNFLSLMSHDLKTPVARIQGNAELLASSQANQLSEGQKKSVDAILNTTEDLSRYVETVLDLTRVESSGIPVQKTSKDINVIIEEIVASKQQLCQDKDMTLAAELEPLFSFKFDAKLIREVLVNLVENAIKYSPKGSRIVLRSKEDGPWVRVTVEDQGFGIPDSEREKIFEKFYRCENPTTKMEKGTGLGLYLVKYFVELHEGLVEVSSELGKGSKFTVSLPA